MTWLVTQMFLPRTTVATKQYAEQEEINDLNEDLHHLHYVLRGNINLEQ